MQAKTLTIVGLATLTALARGFRLRTDLHQDVPRAAREEDAYTLGVFAIPIIAGPSENSSFSTPPT